MAVIVAVAVNTDGRREILGITVMPSEAFTGLARPHLRPRSPFTVLGRFSALRPMPEGHEVADSLRERFRDVAELMDGEGVKRSLRESDRSPNEHDVLAYMTFDESLRLTLHSTNPLERAGKEIKRRTNVVGVRRENSAPRCFLILLTPEPRRRDPPRWLVRHGSRTGGDLVAHCWSRTMNGTSPAAACRWKN